MAYQTNVTVDAEVKAMFAAIEEKWGRIDVLVNKPMEQASHVQLDGLTEKSGTGR
jgi:NAD(P)-dependent dehydrogenase (short-subunit alcohol dehydrogenase family)